METTVRPHEFRRIEGIKKETIESISRRIIYKKERTSINMQLETIYYANIGEDDTNINSKWTMG